MLHLLDMKKLLLIGFLLFSHLAFSNNLMARNNDGFSLTFGPSFFAPITNFSFTKKHAEPWLEQLRKTNGFDSYEILNKGVWPDIGIQYSHFLSNNFRLSPYLELNLLSIVSSVNAGVLFEYLFKKVLGVSPSIGLNVKTILANQSVVAYFAELPITAKRFVNKNAALSISLAPAVFSNKDLTEKATFISFYLKLHWFFDN